MTRPPEKPKETPINWEREMESNRGIGGHVIPYIPEDWNWNLNEPYVHEETE